MAAACGLPTLSGAGDLLIDWRPTEGLPGFNTIEFSIDADEGVGERFRGVVANVTGQLNQINPFGLPTAFQDNNVFFGAAGENPAHDTQFLFDSLDALTIGVAESTASIGGVITGLSEGLYPDPTPFLRVVTDDDLVSYEFSFDLFPGRVPTTFSGLAFPLPQVDVNLSVTSVPAIGLPGFRTYTLAIDAQTSGGLAFDTFVTGPLFQAPGDPIEFRSDLLPGDPLADSHFLLDRDEVEFGPGMGIFESAEGMRGRFRLAGSEDQLDFEVPLVQLTTDQPELVSFEITAIADQLDYWLAFPEQERAVNFRILGGFLVPEPTGIAGIVSILTPVVFGRRRRV